MALVVEVVGSATIEIQPNSYCTRGGRFIDDNDNNDTEAHSRAARRDAMIIMATDGSWRNIITMMMMTIIMITITMSARNIN